MPHTEHKRRAAVTLLDVARLAGVHPGTASRALSEETRHLVNAVTAERILDAADELGYRPNAFATALKTSRSNTIGVVIPDLTNPLFPPIVRGIQDRLEAAGYTPLITNTDNDPERERSNFDALGARQVDGFIVATARDDPALIEQTLGALDRPVVLVNRRLLRGSIPAVVNDDREGARLAVEHLVEYGHRRIALLAGPQNLSTGARRREGFFDAMAAAHLTPDPTLVLTADRFVEQEGERLCNELLDAGRDFTAIVAGNDLMALGCYRALAARGIDCPRQVSVVGFNDMPFAEWFNPPLTTIHIPQYDIGSRAAKLLLELLADPDGSSEREILLAPSLVVRGSTAPPPA